MLSGKLAWNRSFIIFAHRRRADRNLATSSKKWLWTLKKNDNLGAKATSSAVSVDIIPSDQGEEEKCFITPNPNDGNFALILTGPSESSSEVNIFSTNGKIVYQGYVAKGEQIIEFSSLKDIAPGSYIVTLPDLESCRATVFIKH